MLTLGQLYPPRLFLEEFFQDESVMLPGLSHSLFLPSLCQPESAGMVSASIRSPPQDHPPYADWEE